MALTNAGRDHIAGAIIGEGLTSFANANANLGVGYGAGANTAFAATQTDLLGATKVRKAMDATYPTRATNVLTFKSTFGTAEANGNWLEWAIFNAAAAGTMLSRKQEDLGTKTASATWALTAQLTLTV